MPATATFCASDVPVTFRAACNLDLSPSSGSVTLPCSVWLMGTPEALPNQLDPRGLSRMLFKFVMAEDPDRKLGRKLTTGSDVEWDELTLIMLGCAVPTKVDSGQRYAATNAWMLFAELVC